MALDADKLTQDIPEDCPERDRLENFLSALFELKYNISHTEKKYPFLGNELSSLCEETISRLSWPSGTEITPVELEPAVLPLPVESCKTTSSETGPVAIPSPIQQNESPVTEPALTAKITSNSVACSLDAAGGFLVTGLDKMGDGIITAFEKLLSLGPKVRKWPAK